MNPILFEFNQDVAGPLIALTPKNTLESLGEAVRPSPTNGLAFGRLMNAFSRAVTSFLSYIVGPAISLRAEGQGEILRCKTVLLRRLLKFSCSAAARLLLGLGRGAGRRASQNSLGGGHAGSGVVLALEHHWPGVPRPAYVRASRRPTTDPFDRCAAHLWTRAATTSSP